MKGHYVVKAGDAEVEVLAEALGDGRYRVRVGGQPDGERIVERRGGAAAPTLLERPTDRSGNDGAGADRVRVVAVELSGKPPRLWAGQGELAFAVELEDARRRQLRKPIGGAAGPGGTAVLRA